MKWFSNRVRPEIWRWYFPQGTVRLWNSLPQARGTGTSRMTSKGDKTISWRGELSRTISHEEVQSWQVSLDTEAGTCCCLSFGPCWYYALVPCGTAFPEGPTPLWGCS